ncbi:MAG: RNA polymerase sigma factor [Chloroflexia bacterium]
MQTEWDDLAVRARAGDLVARDTLYTSMEGYLFRLAAVAERAARAAPSGLIEVGDLHQEIFVMFCALLVEWQPEVAPFAGFVGAALPNRAHHYVRRLIYRREEKMPEIAADDAAACEFGVAADPADTYMEAVLCRRLLARLDPLDRQVVVMRGILGLPIGEVAERVGLGKRQAYRLYAAARRSLRSNDEF